MAANTDLTNVAVGTGFTQLLHIGDDSGIEATEHYVVDGNGTASALSLGTTAVGIGTESPAELLEVESASDHARILIDHTSTAKVGQLGFAENGTMVAALQHRGSTIGTPDEFAIFTDYANGYVTISTGSNAERLRIDSSGNVDIHEGLQVGGLYTEHAVIDSKSQFTLTWSCGSYDGGYFKIIVSGRPNAFGDAYMESVYSWATATGNVGVKAFTSILAVGETLSVGSETIPTGSGTATVRIDASDTINNGHIIIQSTEPISLTQA